MTYLAAASNRGDTVDLDHVTTPAGRADLAAMRSEAVDLRLDHCTGRPQGDYLCYFDHGYRSGPATAVTAAANPMVVLVGPAPDARLVHDGLHFLRPAAGGVPARPSPVFWVHLTELGAINPRIRGLIAPKAAGTATRDGAGPRLGVAPAGRRGGSAPLGLQGGPTWCLGAGRPANVDVHALEQLVEARPGHGEVMAGGEGVDGSATAGSTRAAMPSNIRAISAGGKRSRSSSQCPPPMPRPAPRRPGWP